jgi:hypothetical protein
VIDAHSSNRLNIRHLVPAFFGPASRDGVSCPDPPEVAPARPTRSWM